MKAINYVSMISKLDENIIMKAKYSLLYHGDIPWEKKNCKNLFDVTMGSMDGAESCMLVGLYILSKLQYMRVNIGLYREDGLGTSSLSSRQLGLAKTKMISTIKNMGLNAIMDFLDINLNLKQVNISHLQNPITSFHMLTPSLTTLQ